MRNQKLGYPDLDNGDFVFEALLGHGMFHETLPPCFTSKMFFECINKAASQRSFRNHAPIGYRASRSINIPRLISIPHPESYWHLCRFIREHWRKINEHIGQPKIKTGYCHVRKMQDKNHIFEIGNYPPIERKKEDAGSGYALGCKYVVKADISNFFPSIYSHSIPWAIDGKNESKQNHSRGVETWADCLDKVSRSLKSAETNGLLIGPHTSNIISEIILTKIDSLLQEKGHKKIIRHIDDYVYYAKDEKDANEFLMILDVYLKEFELHLNPRKTEIVSLSEFHTPHWRNKLFQFKFPESKIIGFSSINSYIDYALEIAGELGDYAILKYAIMVVSDKKLSPRAKKLYIEKILSLSLHYPYLLQVLETHVFKKFANREPDCFKGFLKYQLEIALQHGFTDALAFVFYYAIRYKVKMALINENIVGKIVNLNDCISMTLAYEYMKSIRSRHINHLEEKAREINKIYDPKNPREVDQFWLFLYQVLGESELKDQFLRKLKKHQVEFVKFQR